MKTIILFDKKTAITTKTRSAQTPLEYAETLFGLMEDVTIYTDTRGNVHVSVLPDGDYVNNNPTIDCVLFYEK